MPNLLKMMPTHTQKTERRSKEKRVDEGICSAKVIVLYMCLEILLETQSDSRKYLEYSNMTDGNGWQCFLYTHELYV